MRTLFEYDTAERDRRKEEQAMDMIREAVVGLIIVLGFIWACADRPGSITKAAAESAQNRSFVVSEVGGVSW